MEELKTLSFLRIRQTWDKLETFIPFVSVDNSYVISDGGGNDLYYAFEKGGKGFIAWVRQSVIRSVLNSYRPFLISIIREKDGREILRVSRPFRFFFHQVTISDSKGRTLGTVRRELAVFNRVYSIYGRGRRLLCRIHGPFHRPWTFRIKKDRREYGKIARRWSGLHKEILSNADDFTVEFPLEWDMEKKALLVGATFLIDFVYFEDANAPMD